jgi:uncharacterized membrane protein
MNVWMAAAIAVALLTILLACIATVATMRLMTHCVAPDRRKRTRFACATAALASLAGVFVLVGVGIFAVSVLLMHAGG